MKPRCSPTPVGALPRQIRDHETGEDLDVIGDDDLPPYPRGRDRDYAGRFSGPRVNVEQVPRLPTFPARWVLEDPRQRAYLVSWVAESDGALRYALKMEPTGQPDCVVVTFEVGVAQRLTILRRPLPRGTGTALFYVCPWCQKPRRYLYRLTRSGTKLINYVGVRCHVCARLRFGSQGRYREAFSRARCGSRVRSG